MSLCGAVVFMSYSGCLTSILAVQIFNPPFTSLQNMKQSSSFKLMAFGDGSGMNSILAKVYKNQDLKDVYETSIKPYVMSADSCPSLVRLWQSNDPNMAMLTTEEKILTCHQSMFFTQLERLINFLSFLAVKAHLCDLAKAKFKDVTDTAQGWMYPKNSILQPMFDKFMLELAENGVLENIESTFFRKSTCPDTQAFIEIDIDFVKLLFALLSCGIAIAIFVLIWEKVSIIRSK